MKMISFRIDEHDWELFKKIAEAKGSKGSIKLRELVKDYIRNNTHILDEIVKGGQKWTN